ncbi:HNH endonuclease [Tenacibaculum sp. E3R01]|nr:HNH endonuclease [Tenacibaculum sp. E3R01]
MKTSEIALELNKNKLYTKKDGSEITDFQIHGRTRTYTHLFERRGSTVFLAKSPSKSKTSRPPKWHRDEVILALDLYHRIEAKEMDSKNPKVIEVSEILNRLPIHKNRFENNKFRNPNGVSMKLNNFKAIDPNYNGKGMDRYSNLDKEVFFEFQNDLQSLKRIAIKIKHAVSNDEITTKLYQVGEEEDDERFVKEGRVIYKLHKVRERDSKINKEKKNDYLKKHGKLDCAVCKFDFYEKYGELGKGFIECHHKVPLSEIDGETKTQKKDLALVCANCHRMLHRKVGTMSIDELKKALKN